LNFKDETFIFISGVMSKGKGNLRFSFFPQKIVTENFSLLFFQTVADSRYYVVRYTSSHTSSNPRYRYMNSTVLNCMLDDLKPNTQFEFAVKVIKVKIIF
jgi:hypothetical protein